MSYIKKIQNLIKNAKSNLGAISLNTELYNKLKKEIVKYHGSPKVNKTVLHINGILIYDSKGLLDEDYVLHYRTMLEDENIPK